MYNHSVIIKTVKEQQALIERKVKLMYKDFRYINAGENEIYRYGHKAIEKVMKYAEPNKNGFYSFPVDGLKYWTIGTSNGKYGEFAKVYDTIFSVNSAGFMWAKVGTDKADKFVEFIKKMVEEMKNINDSRFEESEEE